MFYLKAGISLDSSSFHWNPVPSSFRLWLPNIWKQVVTLFKWWLLIYLEARIRNVWIPSFNMFRRRFPNNLRTAVQYNLDADFKVFENAYWRLKEVSMWFSNLWMSNKRNYFWILHVVETSVQLNIHRRYGLTRRVADRCSGIRMSGCWYVCWPNARIWKFDIWQNTEGPSTFYILYVNIINYIRAICHV